MTLTCLHALLLVEMEVSLAYLGWLQITLFFISASHVARIIDLSNQHSVLSRSFLKIITCIRKC
jgi:hypothetical protein